MSTEHELTPSSYIGHHLSFNVKQVAEGGFWTVNFDSLAVSVFLGLMIFGFLWWVVRGATAGVPGKRQAIIELLFEFIDNQVKGTFHSGDRHKFVSPAALTVFVWVFAMNAMDFDDLLFFWHKILRDDEALRKFYASTFTHILVDEYQDDLITSRLNEIYGPGREDSSLDAELALLQHRTLARGKR